MYWQNISHDTYGHTRAKKRARKWMWGRRLVLFVLILNVAAILGLLIIEGEQIINRGSVRADPVAAYTLTDTNSKTNSETNSKVIPSIVPVENTVIVDARVLPVRYASLSMPIGGIVSEVLVEEGSSVEVGTPMVRLKNTQQQADVAQAQAEVVSAQAQLNELLAGTRTQEIAPAQADVDAANARLAQLQEGARSEEMAAAQALLAAAQAGLNQLYSGPEANTLAAHQAELANAEAKRSQARSAYNEVKWHNDIGKRPESLALQEATNEYDVAKARYDALFAEPNADAVAGAHSQVQQAQSDLDMLMAPATQNELAEAQADLRRVQAELDLLTAGTRSEVIAAAQAEVGRAQALLAKAEADLADTELRAIFAGTVASIAVKAGEQVPAGGVVAQVADLSSWTVQTYDLTELDVIHVAEEDSVVMTLDAIDGLELTGRVVYIKPIGEDKEGSVTYTAIIQPDQQDLRLRWNMTVLARIQ